MSIYDKIVLQDKEIQEALNIALGHMQDPDAATLRLQEDVLFHAEAKRSVIEITILVAMAKTLENTNDFQEEAFKTHHAQDPMISELRTVLVDLLQQGEVTPEVPQDVYKGRIETIIQLAT